MRLVECVYDAGVMFDDVLCGESCAVGVLFENCCKCVLLRFAN